MQDDEHTYRVARDDGALLGPPTLGGSGKSSLAILAVLMPMMSTACQTGPQSVQNQAEPRATFSNQWLAENLQVMIAHDRVNQQSGLYEMDAHILAEKLQAGHHTGYRVVVRTLFFDSEGGNVVDTSAWSEISLRPGVPSSYRSTSLTPAGAWKIELAYPQEVGIR